MDSAGVATKAASSIAISQRTGDEFLTIVEHTAKKFEQERKELLLEGRGARNVWGTNEFLVSGVRTSEPTSTGSAG